MQSNIYENLYNKLNDLVVEYNLLISIFDNANKKMENNFIAGNSVDHGIITKCKANSEKVLDLLSTAINVCKSEMLVESGESYEK